MFLARNLELYAYRIASPIEPEAVINVLCENPENMGVEMLSLESLKLSYTFFAGNLQVCAGNAYDA